MQLGNAIERFLGGYFAINPRSNRTRSAYMSDLRQFSQFIGYRSDARVLAPRDIENWVSTLRTQNYSEASIRRKIAVVKVFCSYWLRQGLIPESPFSRLQIRLGRGLQLPRILSELEVTSFLRVASIGLRSIAIVNNPGSKSHLQLRNRAIVEILFATGIRVGEVSAMNLEDFLPDENAFRVHGKGGRERLAYIVDPASLTSLREYRSVREKLETSTNAFFINARGLRLSTQGIANVVLKIAEAGGSTRHITPHMFRHTIATLLLRNGVNMRVVQEFLGHSSIVTTQRYTHVSKEHLRRELLSFHPSLTVQR